MIRYLYEIKVRHFSQKDNIDALLGYVVADNDEQVYEWIKAEPEVRGENLYNSWEYNEEEGEEFDVYGDDYSIIGKENYKDKIIRLKGDIYDDDVSYDDLYYGLTLYGWDVVGTIDDEEIKVLQRHGIIVGVTNEIR